MSGSIVPLPVMLDEEDQKIYEKLAPPSSIVVRYGYQKLIAELDYDGTAKPGCGSKMVITTQRGTEIGEMLTSTCPNAGCSKSVTRNQMLEYIENSGGKDYPFTDRGKILRVATAQDMRKQETLDYKKPTILKTTRQYITELKLDMRVVEVELLLGEERIIIYFSAEKRVDFRQLVKKLGNKFKTRIELMQINAREEARLTADYEKCGQYCCCKNFLKVLKPVSTKSARMQKGTVDPQKISGRCGRLMCCLRYEDETYSDLRKKLPNRYSLVETEDGIGKVVDTQILTQLVLVKISDDRPAAAYPVEHIHMLDKDEIKKHKKSSLAPDTADIKKAKQPDESEYSGSSSNLDNNHKGASERKNSNRRRSSQRRRKK